MNNTITIDSARNIPIGQLSELPIATLASLQRDANDHLDKAKRLKDWLDSAISLKYQNKSTQTREFQDKVTGTIHFNDGNFKVTWGIRHNSVKIYGLIICKSGKFL